MDSHASKICEREFDFALIVGGVLELNERVEAALFRGGCDDATLSIQYGQLYMEFSRSAPSLQEAIMSAIRDVQKSGLPDIKVLRVDECNLATAAEIARRIDRSRQLVHQYMTGQRGPGGFPPPVAHLSEHSPLWAWCAVSYWLAQNNLLRPEAHWDAEVVYAINMALERQQCGRSELLEKIAGELHEMGL